MNFPQVGFLSPLLIVGVKAGLAALLGAWWILAADDVRASWNVTRPVALPQRPPARSSKPKSWGIAKAGIVRSPSPDPHLLLAMRLRCNSFGEAASTQVGITPSGWLLQPLLAPHPGRL